MINYVRNDMVVLLFITVGVAIRYLPQLYYDIANRKRKVLIKRVSIAKARYIFYLYLLTFTGFVLKFGSYPYSIRVITCGISIFLLGITLGLIGVFSLNNQFSEELVRYEGRLLVTHGIYSIVRHPIRIGLFVELLGIVILANSPFLLLPLLGIFILQYIRTEHEELMLKEFFGDAEVKYQLNVPKFNFAFGLLKLIAKQR